MNLDEGYYDVNVFRDEDTDHGPCTGYEVKGDHGYREFTIYLYDNHPTLLSIHEDD